MNEFGGVKSAVYQCIISLLTMIMFHLQIVNVEEEFLVHAFGDEYITYKKKVHRYLGRKI